MENLSKLLKVCRRTYEERIYQYIQENKRQQVGSIIIMLRMLSNNEIKERQKELLNWVRKYFKTKNGYRLENVLYQLKDLLDL